MTQLEAALVEVASACEALGLPYMLIGGLAVAMWGEPRATLDVDVTVWVEPDGMEAAVAGLCARFGSLSRDPRAFVSQTHVLPVTTSQGARADVVFAALPPERESIARAVPKQIDNHTVMVASVEDLLLMKLVSERRKDREDAIRLLRRFKKSIDREYLEPRVRELSEALAQPDAWELLSRELP
jgi:hypothetical protein